MPNNHFLATQSATLLELTKNKAIDAGDLHQAMSEITLAASKVLNCQRASIWLYNPARTSIICKVLYERSTLEFSSGIELMAEHFPAYFKYLDESRVLAASNAHTDPSTFEFSDVYLKPLGIDAMLDAPIRVEGLCIGVLCNEWMGGERIWTTEEQLFASSLADLIARAIEISKRKQAEEELREATRLLQKQYIEIETYNKKLEELVEERTQALEASNKELSHALERQINLYSSLDDEKRNSEAALKALQEAKNQMVQSEKMASLGQLTAGVAHEINNPVNFIAGGAQSLKPLIKDLLQMLDYYDILERPTSEEEKKATMQQLKALERIVGSKAEIKEDTLAMLADIEKGAARVAEIVQGLRNFTRSDSGQKVIDNLHENINSTLIVLSSKYKDRIEVVRQYDESIPQIECYSGQLSQVFMNIIGNGIDAIEGKGSIVISTHNKNNHVLVSIKDTGRGMPEEVKKKIFDPFFTTKEVGKGTGLGLSIVHGIIEKHQGSIEVLSEVGKGSEFIVKLPLNN